MAEIPNIGLSETFSGSCERASGASEEQNFQIDEKLGQKNGSRRNIYWVVMSWKGRLGRGPSSWVAATARRSRTERVVQFLGVQIEGHIVWRLQDEGDCSTQDFITAFTSFVTFTVTVYL